MRRFCSLALSSAIVFGVAACTTKSANAVKVTATDSSCEPEKTALTAGKVTFSVQNKGGKVTELYVLQGSRTVGEVENIGPGTTRSLTVSLKADGYVLNCKPGQQGDGIKTAITVTGSGGETSKAADRKVPVKAIDYAYTGMSGFSAKAGETVEFDLENDATSTEEHEFEVLGPDGKAVGEVGPTKPGKSGEVTLTLAAPGRYTFECGIGDHAAKGMKGEFTAT